MNSSTSTFEARRRLAVLLGVGAIFLGAVAAFNFTYDPYGRCGQTGAIVALKGTAANIPLRIFIRLREVPARVWAETEVVLAGDSRARQLTEEISETVAAHPVLNLGLGGATLEESLSMLELEATRLPHLRLAIVAVPLERLAEAPGANRCREAEPIARSLPRYLLNWQICQDAWAVASATRALGHRPPMPPVHPTTADPREAALMIEMWRGMYAAFDTARAEARLALLQRTLAPLQAREVKVILWAPAVSPPVQRLLEEAHLREPWRKLSGELRALGPLTDLTFAEKLGDTPFSFSDPVHTRQGPQILQALLTGL